MQASVSSKPTDYLAHDTAASAMWAKNLLLTRASGRFQLKADLELTLRAGLKCGYIRFCSAYRPRR